MTQLIGEKDNMHQVPANDVENIHSTGPGSFNLKHRVARDLLFRSLSQLKSAHLTIHDESGVHVFGNDSDSDLQATLKVHNPAFYQQTLKNGSLGAAESYLRGGWSCDDLTSLIRIFARNMQMSHQVDHGAGWLAKWGAWAAHKLRANTRSGARRNIHEHYDLGNDFFKLFLDDTMLYSSAVFEEKNMSLKEASTAKMERICRKLNLKSSDHLLEIGTGWGGFAEYAARNYGCRITTTTISQEQLDFARQRIQQAGLNERVTLLFEDYRDLHGQYDKLVSIEMIEAVGHKNFDTFFGKCSQLLRPDGAFLLQAITMPDQRYDQYLKSVDFIQKYIFPGGCLPSMSAMNSSVGKQTDMQIIHAEDMAPHYARTLECWRHNFWQKIDQVRHLGYSEQFIRMWHYYLCYSEGAFLERATGVVQMLFAKPGCRIDTINTSGHS